MDENTKAILAPRPPVTKLRSLHSQQQLSKQERKLQASGLACTSEQGTRVPYRSNLLEPRPSQDTYIKAFVKLVSLTVVLDPGEQYCIRDITRGGFILAQTAIISTGHESEDSALEFIKCEEDDEIPTDFSIGKGKVR
jgi:hypothetical protein